MFRPFGSRESCRARGGKEEFGGSRRGPRQAIHFINASPRLSKQVLEIGTACLRNFIELGKQWLKLDLSSYSLYLMPIGFLPSAEATAISLAQDEQKVVNYLATLMKGGH